MAGLYLHIPFCASRCIYCVFYSTTHSNLQQTYVNALCHELELRRNYLSSCVQKQDEAIPLISTIYIGGGTPSQLLPQQINQIFSTIGQLYFHDDEAFMASTCEITMECNPDDITPEFAQFIQTTPINRISMGVQTFSNQRLKFLHRRHKAEDIAPAVALLRKYGIYNISIDLMFGFPQQTLADWEYDIWQALVLHVEHISAYSLMYEEGTPLFQLKQRGRVQEINEDLSLAMYQTLVTQLKEAGYEHYEISNFALAGMQSQHNSSYWKSIPYLGIGASAHSYNIESRQWNVSDVNEYISSIQQDKPSFQWEYLDSDTRYNDLITTALRTSRGICISQLEPKYRHYMCKQAQKNIALHLLEIKDGYLRLTPKGIYVSDAVMTDLIYV